MEQMLFSLSNVFEFICLYNVALFCNLQTSSIEKNIYNNIRPVIISNVALYDASMNHALDYQFGFKRN